MSALALQAEALQSAEDAGGQLRATLAVMEEAFNFSSERPYLWEAARTCVEKALSDNRVAIDKLSMIDRDAAPAAPAEPIGSGDRVKVTELIREAQGMIRVIGGEPDGPDDPHWNALGGAATVLSLAIVLLTPDNEPAFL